MSAGMASTTQLWFTAPKQIELRKVSLPAPTANQVLVRTLYSAISAGTELLAYRGQLPADLALDSTLESLQQHTSYPMQYGYACVGEIVKVGSGLDAEWAGRQVFSFQPHASHFLTDTQNLQLVPDDIPARAAAFLPNTETAVNLVHDGAPVMGERVVVLGQGVVGLLLTALLAKHPLAELIVVEGRAERQALAKQLGAHRVVHPDEAAAQISDADLIYEVSGQPAALDTAVAVSGYSSRIVIGSWYGNKEASINLGGAAHRNRLQLITSQVSTVAPALTGRWDKQRRFELAWQMIRECDPQRLISHVEPIQDAGSVYQQLDEEKLSVVQALFEYPDS